MAQRMQFISYNLLVNCQKGRYWDAEGLPRPCRWTLSGSHAIGQVSSNIVPMPRFLYVDPSCLYPTAMPMAPPQHRVGPASQAYCVLPWLMMTSGHLGEPLLFQSSLVSGVCSSRLHVQFLSTEDLLAGVVVFLDLKGCVSRE